MPWQQLVADVAFEVNPITGNLFYRQVVLVVPRQSGKTTLILAAAVHRALGFGKPQRIVYTAQTRNDARVKWEDDHVAMLDASPIGRRRPKPYRVRKTNGNEAILWRNGSQHGIAANTEKSGHGPTLDLGFVDEAFSQIDNRMEQAFRPAMITRAGPQMWVVSTAGKSKVASPFLWSKIEAGRERVADGELGAVAYFEWSAPDDLDRADPATWWATMPALGHTVTEETIADEFSSMDAADFDRAYLNRWNPHATDTVIPMDKWVLLGDSQGITGELDFAVDVTPDRSFTAISAAGKHVGDGTATEVIDHLPGTGWAVERLVELKERHGMRRLIVDGAGPVASLLPDMEAAGLPVHLVSYKDYIRSCGSLLDAIVQGTDHHAFHPSLEAAAAAAVRQQVGDGWKFSRRMSAVDISTLVAISLARWGHLEVEAPVEAADFFTIG